MSIQGANSPGTQINRLFDALGYPDSFGDAIGAVVDMKSGNLAGAMRNLVDLKSGLTTGQMDRLFGRAGMPEFGRCFCPKLHFTGPHLVKYQHTYTTSRRVGTQAHVGQSYKQGGLMGALGIRGRISGKQYRGSFARPIRLGKEGYLYRGRKYASLGAIKADIRDGRVDGLATRRHTRTGWVRMPFMTRLPNMINNLFTPGWVPNMANVFKQLGGLAGAGAAGAASGAGASAGAGAAGAAAGAAGGASDTGSVLSNPNLTLEDKLALLMAKLSEHLDKKIEDKMKEIEKAMQAEKSGQAGGGKKSGGGIFGKILGGIGKMFGGPVGGVVGAVGGLLGGGGSKGAGAAGGAGGDGKKPNLQLLQTQLQEILQKRQQMFQTMSSILKSLHDTSMSAIRNLKA